MSDIYIYIYDRKLKRGGGKNDNWKNKLEYMLEIKDEINRSLYIYISF